MDGMYVKLKLIS